MLPSGHVAPKTIFEFTQAEYDNEGLIIEKDLLPDWLPYNWMSDIDRVHRDRARELRGPSKHQ